MTATPQAQPATRTPARFTLACATLACALLAACGDQGGRPATSAPPADKPGATTPATTPTTPTTVEASCLSPAVAQVFKDLLTEGVEARARADNKDLPDHRRLDLSKVRATAATTRVELQDVVTTKNDPNSSKKFCEATLHLAMDTQDIAKADQQRSRTPGVLAVRPTAEDAGFRVDVNRFSRRVSYSVQPTDDRSKLFVSLDDAATYVNLVGEVVIWSVANTAGGQIQAQSPTTVTNPTRPSDEKPVALSASDEALRDDLERSRTRFHAAERDINVVWRALPQSVRDTHLQAQRQFNKDKEARCFRQASEAGSGVRFEITKNHCWADLYDRRTLELKALN